ncbi:MAG: hypothetical protein GEV10_26590 [Streptosporangiales bacterium]|nr:hypothetical protein [Streptosporangiales bacterium]
MIGVVGPRDSVAQVEDVARQMSLSVPLAPRPYRTPGSVVDLAAELDETCSVILFTGRVPFALASSVLRPRSHLEYIPHEGADLLRVVARLLMSSTLDAGEFRVSLDSIETALAREVCADVGVGADGIRTIPLVLRDSGAGFSADEVARQHQELYATGEVDICLTCLDSVHRLLRRRGVPVERITHARMVVRAALERCLLATRLDRASAAQIAVCLVAPSVRARDSGDSLLDALVRDTAMGMAADLVDGFPPHAKLVTTRGAVERWLAGEAGAGTKLRETEFAGIADLGVGFGATVVLAEQNARRALTHAQREGRPYVMRDDGLTSPADPSRPAYRARVTQPATLAISREVGLSPVSLQRLVHVLHRIDSQTVTAAGLASSYGVSPRSARRLLAKLVAGGYAVSVGTEQGGGAGRPQAVYDVRLDRLVLD